MKRCSGFGIILFLCAAPALLAQDHSDYAHNNMRLTLGPQFRF